MGEIAIESTTKRKRNGHPAIGHESYRRTREVVASTPEPRMSLIKYTKSYRGKNRNAAKCPECSRHPPVGGS